MFRRALLVFCLLGMTWISHAQENPWTMELEGQAGFTTSDQVPFWMRSNQYGNVPVAGPSVSAIGRIKKDYVADSTGNKRLLDWGMGFEGRANGGQNANLILVEGYAKARLAMFELKGGRSKQVMGLMDTTLSTGSFIMSGTALGVPKVEISIPEFFSIPLLDGILAVKGNFAHGWLGHVNIYNNEDFVMPSFFHQKSLWGRIAKPHWRTRFYGGFSHNVFWGNEKKWIGYFPFNDWQSYEYIVFGKVFNDSKVGNHGGTIDFRVEHDFQNVSMAVYRQNFYEVGGLYYLANIADGLNGISLTNRQPKRTNVFWKKLLFEFLYTKNQAGETWSKPTPTGDENYMNHYLYKEGWSYRGIGMGTPFISRRTDVRGTLPAKEMGRPEYFINNRLMAFHAGVAGEAGAWDITAKLSYSRNFGTRVTETEFPVVGQLSAYLEGSRPLKNGMHIGGVLALDTGKLLYNSTGIMLKVVKAF